MEEIWKNIDGFEGLYQISDFGNVKSFHRKKNGELLKGGHCTDGYKFFHLSQDGASKHLYVHTAIAKYFIPNPDNKEQVNHINGIKTDNRIENLEWVSTRENTTHHKVVLLTGSRSSKYHGVHRKHDKKRTKPWVAALCIGKKTIALGHFHTEEEAHEAYQKALIERDIENKYAIAS